MNPRGERGSALVLASLLVLVLACIAAVLLLAGAIRAEGERVRGAADLAALAGARAQGEGREACVAAGESAALNTVEVVACRVTGDEVEFVVGVEVAGGSSLPWTGPLRAQAFAGMVTGAPE